MNLPKECKPNIDASTCMYNVQLNEIMYTTCMYVYVNFIMYHSKMDTPREIIKCPLKYLIL